MRCINRPFACIVVLAVLAVLSRIILVHHFWVPSIIRFHLADFGFPAVFTVLLSTLANLVTPKQFRLRHVSGLRWTHLAFAFAGMIQGLRIEFEDLVGEEQSDVDIGVLMSKWLGTPNTETFDWLDVLAICLGGLVVILLQWYATRHLATWRRFPLFLKA